MADTGNVQGLVRTSKDHVIFFQILQEHEVELFFPPPLHVSADYWQQQSAAGPLFSLLRCGESDVTCFVQPLHQNFLFCHRAAKIQSVYLVHEGACTDYTQPHWLDLTQELSFEKCLITTSIGQLTL